MSVRVLSLEGGELAIWRAANFFTRARGLLGRAPLAAHEGLLIVPCSSVHTIGMRYAIDVVFLDHSGIIRRIVPRLRPWRAAGCPGSRAVLELQAGSAERLGLRPDLPLADLAGLIA